jgi:probable F420-dependent oxidoreductase
VDAAAGRGEITGECGFQGAPAECIAWTKNLNIPLQLFVGLGSVLGTYALFTFPNGKFGSRWVLGYHIFYELQGVCSLFITQPILVVIGEVSGWVSFPIIVGILIYRYRHLVNAKERVATKWLILSWSTFILFVIMQVLIFAVSPADSFALVLVSFSGFFGCGINIAGFLMAVLYANAFDIPMACGPLLTAAAKATTTLRIGSYVYNNDFRHPAVLAKEAATIDVLSGGRLELGVGAGYHKEEYDEVGLPFDTPGVRVSRFEESLEIMRRLFTGERVSYTGQYYQLSGHEGMPLPIQQPLPLLIGGGGPRMVRLAARRAEIVGFVPQAPRAGGIDTKQFTPESMDDKIALLERAVTIAGRTDGGPERNLLLFGIYTSLEEAAARGLDGLIPGDQVAASPYALVGDTEAMVDTLYERRERWGISYPVCFAVDLDKFLPIVRKLSGQ